MTLPGHSRLRAFVLAAFAALALASCGDDADVASGPASLMPADAPLYVEAVVSPEGEQAERIDALLAKLGELPLIGTVTNPGDLIKGAIEDSATSSGVSLDFAEDVDPWLGERIGFSVLSAEDDAERFVAALETTDEDATKAALQRILEEDSVPNEEHTYEDVTYYTSGTGGYGVGVFDGHLVLATIAEFEAAVDAAAGSENLADGDQLADATSGLADDRLATLFLDLGQFAELMTESPEDLEKLEQAKEAVPEIFEEPLAIGLGVDEQSIYVEQVSPELEGQPALAGSGNLASVPGDSLGAIGLDGLGDQITFVADLYDRAAEAGADLEDYPKEGAAAAFEEETGIALADATAALGDGTLWVRGRAPDALEIGSRVTVTDEETVTDLIDQLREQAEEEEGARAIGPPLDPSAEGFSVDLTVSDPTSEFELLNLEVSDGSLRAGLFSQADSAESAPDPPEEILGESEAFARAEEVLGSEYELLGLASLEPIIDAALAEAGLGSGVSPFGNPEVLAAGFIADKFDVLAIGTSSSNGRTVVRFAQGIAE